MYIQVYINILNMYTLSIYKRSQVMLKVDREIERFLFVFKSSDGFFVFHFIW